MLYAAAAFLTALTLTLLAYASDRMGHHTIAAMFAAGAWLFAGICLLILVLIWVWR